MARKGVLFLILFLTFSLSAASFEFKKNALVTPLENQLPETYYVAPHFATAEACTVRHDVGAYWMITHWITGNELYKSYQNPGLSCDAPYPFSVENIYIMLAFDVMCTVYVSVDVETADLSAPSCPFPGDLVSISTTYEVVIPGSGLYQIEFPLDSPAVVDGPYFAGLYFADVVDSLTGAALITDSIPVGCVSYNIWDTAIGYVDLNNTGFPTFPQFPGRLLLFSGGTTGGTGGEEPEPAVTILQPSNNEIIPGDAKIWAAETAGSRIIDYMIFDYRSTTGSWIEIGRDEDGARALRNGVDTSGTGEGYTINWNYSGLTEGLYWLKATVYDTLGRSDIDSVRVSIDPTPPAPTLVDPALTDTICLPMTLEAASDDEDISVMKFEKKNGNMNYETTVLALDQSHYGDKNGNAGDGNHAASGEYGDYYCGPVAGAIAIKYWFDKGYIYGMREGNQYISIDTVVERLAANMLTRKNHGTYDDLFFGGMQQYIITHGNELRLGAYRNPDYLMVQTLYQDRELSAILGFSGTPGLYAVLGGISGQSDGTGKYAIKLSDPISGTLIDAYIRNSIGGSEVYYGSVWHKLDIIITVVGYTEAVVRDYIGADNSASGGWTYDWTTTTGMFEDSLCFITATAQDSKGRLGTTTSLSLYKCNSLYSKGDYDGNGAVNIGDAIYLIDYIYRNGDAPVGGAGRADANCDGTIDSGDVIYIIRHVLQQSAEPCY